VAVLRIRRVPTGWAVADRQLAALTGAGPRRPRGLVNLIDDARCRGVGEEE
jgi:hypothetical protein